MWAAPPVLGSSAIQDAVPLHIVTWQGGALSYLKVAAENLLSPGCPGDPRLSSRPTGHLLFAQWDALCPCALAGRAACLSPSLCGQSLTFPSIVNTDSIKAQPLRHSRSRAGSGTLPPATLCTKKGKPITRAPAQAAAPPHTIQSPLSRKFSLVHENRNGPYGNIMVLKPLIKFYTNVGEQTKGFSFLI